MAKKIANRRCESRHGFPGDLGAEIEFDDPAGQRHQLPLEEISIGGAGFTLPRKIPGVEKGSMLTGGVIRVGRTEIRVGLMVCRLTRGFGFDYGCGVQMFPGTDEDRNRLIRLLSRLEGMA